MTHPTHRALTEVAWLRQLALSIVRDAHEADDAVQDAWVRALGSRGGDVRDPRAWWGTILRRAWSTKQRDAARRRAREIDTARHEALDDTADVVARVQQQKVLLEIVESLDEPYRTTILLRFFEDLPPRAIAARMQVPVATVHTRIKRALETLRGELERRHGSRDAWLAALAPIAAPPAGADLAWIPYLGMKTHTKLLLVAAGLVAGLGGWYALSRGPAESASAPIALADTSTEDTDATRGARLAATSSAPTPRVEIAPTQAAATPPAIAAPAAATRRVNGRLLDPDGGPLAGLLVAQEGSNGSVTARSDATGRFQIELADAAVLVVAEPGWCTVLYGSATGGESVERVVVAARALAIDGDVVDATTAAVWDAQVSVGLPEGFRARFAGLLDYSGTMAWSTTSDRDGRFQLTDVPCVDGAVLGARHHGHAPASIVLHERDGGRLAGVRLQLGARATHVDDVVGIVVDARGTPLPDAAVAAGGATDSTNARGEFRLARAKVGAARTLRAVKTGFLPGGADVPDGAELVRVVLAGPALSIAGRVVDDQGHAIVHAKVWVADPTFFGYAPHVGMDTTVEGLAAVEMRHGDVDRYWKATESIVDPLEYRKRAGPLPFWNFARTDEDGRFVLPGLAARAYALRAMDVRTLQTVELQDVAAGARDVELVLAARDVWPVLRGSVVDATHRPVPGVRIAIATTVLAVPVSETTTTYRGEGRGDEAVTDAEGRFELRDVPANAALVLTGDHVRHLEFGSVRGPRLPELVGDAPLDVRIVVAWRLHVRVDASLHPELADEALVLDGEGRTLRLERLEGYGSFDATSIPIRGGRSDSWNVDETARTLVLRKGGLEVRRVPLRLEPIVENVIRP